MTRKMALGRRYSTLTAVMAVRLLLSIFAPAKAEADPRLVRPGHWEESGTNTLSKGTYSYTYTYESKRGNSKVPAHLVLKKAVPNVVQGEGKSVVTFEWYGPGVPTAPPNPATWKYDSNSEKSLDFWYKCKFFFTKLLGSQAPVQHGRANWIPGSQAPLEKNQEARADSMISHGN